MREVPLIVWTIRSTDGYIPSVGWSFVLTHSSGINRLSQDWGAGNTYLKGLPLARPSLPLPRYVPHHRGGDLALTQDGTGG